MTTLQPYSYNRIRQLSTATVPPVPLGVPLATVPPITAGQSMFLRVVGQHFRENVCPTCVKVLVRALPGGTSHCPY